MTMYGFDGISVYKPVHSTWSQTACSEHMSEEKLPEAGPGPGHSGTSMVLRLSAEQIMYFTNPTCLSTEVVCHIMVL